MRHQKQSKEINQKQQQNKKCWKTVRLMETTSQKLGLSGSMVRLSQLGRGISRWGAHVLHLSSPAYKDGCSPHREVALWWHHRTCQGPTSFCRSELCSLQSSPGMIKSLCSLRWRVLWGIRSKKVQRRSEGPWTWMTQGTHSHVQLRKPFLYLSAGIWKNIWVEIWLCYGLYLIHFPKAFPTGLKMITGVNEPPVRSDVPNNLTAIENSMGWHEGIQSLSDLQGRADHFHTSFPADIDPSLTWRRTGSQTTPQE